MSIVPETLPASGAVHVSHDDPPPNARAGLPRAAQIYLLILGLATIAAAGRFYLKVPSVNHSWLAFALLATAATVAQVFPVKSPRNLMYHTSVVFLVAAALLLPPELLVLIPLVQTVPEWLKERYPWPIQVFNVSNYTLNALAMWGVIQLILGHGGGVISNPDARFAVAGLAAAITYVCVNHVFVALILKLGRGHSFRETGLFSVESLSIDLVLAVLGVSLAAFWHLNPWLVFAALAPLVVVHRSLSVPQLQAEARVDPKTGLYNARYFATTLAAEIARAARFERPMSLIMADLDLLRDINNSYGHLAGDAVLQGIAEIFRSQLRHYDVPARFGGEEFSILLPETPPDQALEIAERIRRAVAEREFEVETAAEPDARHGLDRRRRVPEGRLGRERADPPGRPRRLPREAPGTQPRPRRQHRAAAARGGARRQAARRPGGRRAHRAAARRRPDRDGRGAPPAAAARDGTDHASSRSRRASRSSSPPSASSASASASPGSSSAQSTDYIGLLAILALVGGGQALSLELAEIEGSISVSAVGSLAGAALFDYRAALPLALTVVDRRVERPPHVAASRALQHRHALPGLARRRVGHVGRHRQRHDAPPRRRRPGRRRRRRLLRREHGPAQHRRPPSRATRARGRCSTSGSPGCCRTTSSTASSARSSRWRTTPSASTRSPSSPCRSC